ncbi:MAG: hypothetical protein KC620_25140, partial [Myxococcales bacterium]|nr:hypothetical protein [Myxococcales bacterium]
ALGPTAAELTTVGRALSPELALKHAVGADAPPDTVAAAARVLADPQAGAGAHHLAAGLLLDAADEQIAARALLRSVDAAALPAVAAAIVARQPAKNPRCDDASWRRGHFMVERLLDVEADWATAALARVDRMPTEAVERFAARFAAPGIPRELVKLATLPLLTSAPPDAPLRTAPDGIFGPLPPAARPCPAAYQRWFPSPLLALGPLALADANPDRPATLWVIADRGRGERAIRAPLRRLLDDPDPSVATEAGRALIALDPTDAEAMALLVQNALPDADYSTAGLTALLKQGDRGVARRAADLLTARLTGEPSPALTRWLLGPDSTAQHLEQAAQRSAGGQAVLARAIAAGRNIAPAPDRPWLAVELATQPVAAEHRAEAFAHIGAALGTTLAWMPTDRKADPWLLTLDDPAARALSAHLGRPPPADAAVDLHMLARLRPLSPAFGRFARRDAADPERRPTVLAALRAHHPPLDAPTWAALLDTAHGGDGTLPTLAETLDDCPDAQALLRQGAAAPAGSALHAAVRTLGRARLDQCPRLEAAIALLPGRWR